MVIPLIDLTKFTNRDPNDLSFDELEDPTIPGNDPEDIALCIDKPTGTIGEHGVIYDENCDSDYVQPFYPFEFDSCFMSDREVKIKKWKEKVIDTTTCIIYTPYDAYKATRLIFQSAPIGRICTTKDLYCFHLEDRVDHVKEMVWKHRKPCYPILDENEKIVGILTRYHLLRPRRKRVVLVDHNEASQSVPGLEEAEILEIIDHHRLADIQTNNPIFVRNEPVGSTNTIIASMYQDKGLLPSEKLAGMMAAAILSDTVMFKSPTCTTRDIRTAERMARIANVSLDELGEKIFSESVVGKTAEDLLHADYKEFHIAGHDLAVSQITCLDSASVLSRKTELLDEMQKISEKTNAALVILMITDVLMEGSYLLYLGDDDIISQAFDILPKDNEVFLPNVMSRKKQVIPSLSALWG